MRTLIVCGIMSAVAFSTPVGAETVDVHFSTKSLDGNFFLDQHVGSGNGIKAGTKILVSDIENSPMRFRIARNAKGLCPRIWDTVKRTNLPIKISVEYAGGTNYKYVYEPGADTKNCHVPSYNGEKVMRITVTGVQR